MTHDELRRDAERLANLDEPQDMTADDMAAKDRLAKHVKAMYDPTPVDVKWLRRVGFEERRATCLEYRIPAYRWSLRPVNGGLAFCDTAAAYHVVLKTRGDVLRLLDALGVDVAS